MRERKERSRNMTGEEGGVFWEQGFVSDEKAGFDEGKGVYIRGTGFNEGKESNNRETQQYRRRREVAIKQDEQACVCRT